MPNWVGDFVMATPLLHDLRQAYPDSEITVMCLEWLAPILQNDPVIDELFCFRTQKGFFRRSESRSIVAHLRRGKYDLGILTTNSFSSAWRFYQGHVVCKIGFAGEWRTRLLDVPIDFSKARKSQHIVKTYKELLRPLGIPISSTPPKLQLKDEEMKKAWEFVKRFDIKPEHKIVGVNPGAAYGSAKCWLPDRFRAVAKKIVDRDDSYRVLFFGDGSQKQLIGEICKELPPQVVNLSGQTGLRELMSLLKICSAILTNDSGPMHLADALGVPLVALFGSTDPIVTGPYEQPHQVVRKPVPCSPCFRRECPIDFPCMKKIEVDEVAQRLLTALETT